MDYIPPGLRPAALPAFRQWREGGIEKISLREHEKFASRVLSCHTPAKKAKNRPKIEKNSNLKVDALPYSSTDSTHFYREYYLGIPLSIAGIKNYFGWTAKK